MTDTTTLRVQHNLLTAAIEAYRYEEPVTCACCGSMTSTHDGYDVPTPLGDVIVCLACNRDPLLWDPAEVFFVGATRPVAIPA